ncbi:MAG TPA: hypothetical protein PKY35_10120 [Candidatus Hydrogenedentes bacterium]|nr:hypothetical protein [Candidatus Hydrogenedentota bacterium]HOL77376.1 hypothetical protein [Candidatus Hydrogenedentota bacterium]HPO84806.1 hypothetical protein [Candidatus Hydrogenedentota bacterium]
MKIRYVPVSPSFRIASLVLVAISLSIGWGIRGNFGHEYGAMIPGVLAAIAVCLVSGREDWRDRVSYFAFFGALGWAFGGSMSYMKVVNYTQSGHLPSILYGFGGLFLGGFLWASLGSAGTAYAAVADEKDIQALFKPLMWILGVWTVYYFLWEPVMNLPVISSLTGGVVTGPERGLFREMRQNDPFYWLDSDWIPALFALVAVCLFELFSRRSRDIFYLPLFIVLGMIGGALVQKILVSTDVMASALPWLVRVQGDLTVMSPEDGRPFDAHNMVTNWPKIFHTYSQFLGFVFGGVLGAVIYFRKYGKWQDGAALLLYMSVGWFAVFLLFPVILGFRMTPPRNDNWAGVLGVLLGAYLYCFRNRLKPVVHASIVGGTIGGFGIAFTQCLKLLLIAPGNPNRLVDLPPDLRETIVRSWAHWQSANWHSIVIEQGVGLIYGLGLAVALGFVAQHTNTLPARDTKSPHWTRIFAVFFILGVVIYLNMVKNVTEFTKLRGPGENFRCMPEVMKAPLFENIELSTRTWFNLAFILYGCCLLSLLYVHCRKSRIPFVPTSSLGKGQLLYLVFLWIVITFNFEKALVGFHEQRLGTEGVLFVNALLATFLISYCPSENDRMTPVPKNVMLRPVMIYAVTACIFCIVVFTSLIRLVYGDKPAGAGMQGGRRFGPQAEWRLYPILRDREHR